MRGLLIQKIDGHCEWRVDARGNLLCHKKGKKPAQKRVMITAHMDEAGFMLTGIREDGLLRFANVGEIDSRVVLGKAVRIDSEVIGVIGTKPIHLQTREEQDRPMPLDQLYIDIGASTKEEAEKLVSVGDYVSFRSDWREFGAGLVKAKALDDRVGCMTLMSLLENDYPCDITCAFTVQEEIGLRGAACVGHNVEADEAIVLEGTTSNDLGDVPSHLRVCRVGAGVAISFMDRASVSSRPVWQKLRDAAEEEGVAWQFKQSVSGGNDAGAIQLSRDGVPTGVLSVPCRNIHSGASVAAFSDIEAQYRLADSYLRRQ